MLAEMAMSGPGGRRDDATDLALLQAIAERDMAAFEGFYRRYFKKVLRFAIRITDRMDTAEEVAGDTLMTVWRSAGAFAAVDLGVRHRLPHRDEGAPQGRARDWSHVEIDEGMVGGGDGQDLILTVALGEQEELAVLARRIEARHGVTLVAEWPLNAIAVHCFVVDAGAHPDLGLLEARMQADAEIRTVQRMQEFRPLAVAYRDDLFQIQDGLRMLNAAESHEVATGASVRIGVVDTGIDAGHPDLAERMAMSRDFVGLGQGAPAGELHGTAMAGIIAADGQNGLGMVSVAPEAVLIGLRACWEASGETGREGRCNSFSLARALNFALLNDIDILNLSLGGPPDPLLEELIRAGLARGIVVVAAADSSPAMPFPASVAGVIAAAPRLAAPAVQSVPAPARDIISAAPGGRYDFYSGSSVAAAHVSGVAALLLATHPDLGGADIRHALARGISGADASDSGMILDTCFALRAVTNDPRANGCE